MGLSLPEVLVARGDDGATWYLHLPNGVATHDGTAWTYSAADGLGSVRQRLDGSGQVVSVESYRPFGSPLEGDGGAPYGYTGEWWEDGAGLLYLRARYYEPVTGRFVSRDPWKGDVGQPGTLHRYGYTLNSPVGNIDPSGHRTCGPSAYVYPWDETCDEIINLCRRWPNHHICADAQEVLRPRVCVQKNGIAFHPTLQMMRY